MNREDREAIDGLFERLDRVMRRGEVDGEAADHIEAHLKSLPDAPYFMAQTILVQEHALDLAEKRIAELEGTAQGGRGMARVPRTGGRGPWGAADDYPDRGRSGGFLAGAAQTAMGVAGGVLIGNAIGSMFGGGEAHAAESPADAGTDGDDGGDSGGDGDPGGFDGGGGFDFGGDF